MFHQLHQLFSADDCVIAKLIPECFYILIQPELWPVGLSVQIPEFSMAETTIKTILHFAIGQKQFSVGCVRRSHYVIGFHFLLVFLFLLLYLFLVFLFDFLG